MLSSFSFSREFPLWLSRLRSWLVSMRMWVQSPVSLSGLRIPCCHELRCRSQTQLGSSVAVAMVWTGSCSSDSTPALGTSICCECSPEKTEKIPISFSNVVIFWVEVLHILCSFLGIWWFYAMSLNFYFPNICCRFSNWGILQFISDARHLELASVLTGVRALCPIDGLYLRC